MERGKFKDISHITFKNNIPLRYSSEDVRLLWRLGKYILSHGVRRDLDAAITDMHLGRGERDRNLGPDKAQRLRVLTDGLDAGIEDGLLHPRLEKIRELIIKLNT